MRRKKSNKLILIIIVLVLLLIVGVGIYYLLNKKDKDIKKEVSVSSFRTSKDSNFYNK